MWRSVIKKKAHSIRLPALGGIRGNRLLRVPAALCAGLLVLNVLVYALASNPASARLAAAQERIADLRRGHGEAVLFLKQKKLVAGLLAGVPEQKDAPLLIKELVAMARRRHLAVGAIDSDIPKQAKDGLAMLTFKLPASGSYGNVKRFLYDVETMDRLVGIQDAKLKTDKGRVKLDLTLLTYVSGS